MKIALIAVGKTVAEYLKTGIDEYVGRIGHFAPFSMEIIPDLKNTRNVGFETQKQQEGALILKQLQAGDYVVLLDDKGQQFTSPGMAKWLDTRMGASGKRIVFIIGGPYGFSKDVYAAANAKISMSSMTFSHQMVRLIFLEQLYRAFTILKGLPYHHE